MTEEAHNEQDIANLLSQLGDQTPEFPPERLAERRAAYQQSIAGMEIGLAARTGLKGGVMHTGLTVDTILKGLIVAVLLIEVAGGIIYYRYHRNHLSGPNPLAGTPTPTLTATITPTRTATSTATPTLTQTATLIAPFTPTAHPADQGHHFGQTATPPAQRTRAP
jgi:hypothetical protein